MILGGMIVKVLVKHVINEWGVAVKLDTMRIRDLIV